MARARNELLRVPGAVIPGVLAPTIFFLGINGVFGALTHLRGFPTDNYPSFLVPVSMLQSAGFTGAAAGVNLARDIEQGRFDRLLVSPAPRWVLLSGSVLSASARSLIPATFVLGVALAVGADFPGVDGLLVAYAMVAAMAAVAACWGWWLALRFKTQSASPLMQAGMLAAIFLTPAYAPLALLEGWLEAVAQVNPVTHVLEAARQGFLGGVSWADTWPGILAAAGMLALLAACPARDAPNGTLTLRASKSPSGSFARTGWRASATACPSPTRRPSPEPLPVAVVLGLLLRGDRLAAVRLRPGAKGAGEPARRPSVRTASSATRSSGTGRSPGPGCPSTTSLSRGAFQTETIQPPLLAWAWRIAVGDPAEEPRIAAQMEWLAANRDLEGDGLLWIVQPDESGLDASPKFDPVWGWRANSRIGFPLLVRRNRRLGFDARRVRERGGPVLCEVARQHDVVALAAGDGPALGDAGAGRAALGRAPRRLRRRGAARRGAAAGPHLRGPGAAGPARPARGDRPPPGRGAPARTGASSSPRWRRPRSPPRSPHTSRKAATA